jgi:hypothetical protein
MGCRQSAPVMPYIHPLLAVSVLPAVSPRLASVSASFDYMTEVYIQKYYKSKNKN